MITGKEKSKKYIPDYWKAMELRLHEESGLHNPLNEIGQMFNIFFNEMLHQFSEDNRLFLDQGFLATAEGLYLDIFGKEMGLPRRGGKYAKGTVKFSLTRKIPQEEEPEKITNESEEGLTFDFQPEKIQDILDELNEERKNDASTTTILELREAESNIPIFKGTKIYSDTGFEYITTEEVTLPKGHKFVSVPVIARESGERYNAEANTLSVFDSSSIDDDLIVMNIDEIKGGEEEENDGSYRQRLLNNKTLNISVNHLVRNGVIVYTKENVDDDIRIKTTSNNPYLNNKYALIPPENEVKEFIIKDLLMDDNVRIYIMGW